MTTGRLLLLRMYNKTFGRSNYLAKALKKKLIKKLILKGNKRYTATSKFFDFNDLK